MIKNDKIIKLMTDDLIIMESKRQDFFKAYRWNVNKAADDLILDNYVTYLKLKDECVNLLSELPKANKEESYRIEEKIRAKMIREKGFLFKMGIV